MSLYRPTKKYPNQWENSHRAYSTTTTHPHSGVVLLGVSCVVVSYSIVLSCSLLLFPCQHKHIPTVLPHNRDRTLMSAREVLHFHSPSLTMLLGRLHHVCSTILEHAPIQCASSPLRIHRLRGRVRRARIRCQNRSNSSGSRDTASQ